MAASLAALFVAGGCKRDREFPPPGSPNLVVISLDTLRADHLGCYGYERPTSPNIDAFAERATLFETALSTASKTAESHMTMFTSLYGSVHGVGTLKDADQPGVEVPVLGSGIETLAGILYDRGYATAGYHSGGFMRAKFGFDRGFELYEEGRLGNALYWLGENASDRPFFLLYHTYDVHDPYTPKPPYDTMFTDPGYDGRIVHDLERLKKMSNSDEWTTYTEKYWSLVDPEDQRDVEHLVALYDGEIAALDAGIARLFATIEEYAPDTVVVIVSDHGEEFGEHGAFVHNHIYGELLHVPLIIREPGQESGARIETPVSFIDLAPTILDLLGVERPEQFQGRSLVPLMSAEGSDPAVPVRTELFSSLESFGLKTVRADGWRLVSTKEGFELFDLRKDPREQANLLGGSPAGAPRTADAFERLKASLDRWDEANAILRRQYDEGRRSEALDDETLDQLRNLGYLD
jgi:arylsulfatase A-like enzyme